MLSFCDFIKAKSDKTKDDIRLGNPNKDKTLYEVDLKDITNLKIIANTRDTVKINRFYDLGDERIVLQTRFGIDGDVVTRIEEDFSNRPKQLVLDIHDEHTNMSVGYWKSLIDIAKGIIFND